MLIDTPQQISIPQNVISRFLKVSGDSYEEFVNVWRNEKASNVHDYPSPDPLLYGPCQTAYSTFIGFCDPEKDDNDRKGGLFGLYLTYSTQFSLPKFPVFISVVEFKWLQNIGNLSGECSLVFQKMVKENAFVFVPFQISIKTKDSLIPSPVVIHEPMLLSQVSGEKIEKTKSELKTNNNECVNELLSKYKKLLDEIRSDDNLN